MEVKVMEELFSAARRFSSYGNCHLPEGRCFDRIVDLAAMRSRMQCHANVEIQQAATRDQLTKA